MTCAHLEVMGVPYCVIDDTTKEAQMTKMLSEAKALMAEGRQYAVIVKKGTFEKGQGAVWENGYSLVREQALRVILENLFQESFLVSTTGKI